MTTLLRQYILKKPGWLFASWLRSIPCPSLLCCVLHGSDPSNHTYQASLTNVFLSGFGQWEATARLWRTGRLTKPGYISTLFFFNQHLQQLLSLLSDSNFCSAAKTPGPRDIPSSLYSFRPLGFTLASCGC